MASACCGADAADAEGECLKAEVHLLRSTAKRNAQALAQLEQQHQQGFLGAVQRPRPAAESCSSLDAKEACDVVETAQQVGPLCG